jgi:hypothetical protein
LSGKQTELINKISHENPENLQYVKDNKFDEKLYNNSFESIVKKSTDDKNIEGVLEKFFVDGKLNSGLLDDNHLLNCYQRLIRRENNAFNIPQTSLFTD